MRDVTSDAIVDRAVNFLFQDDGAATPEKLRELADRHEKASEEIRPTNAAAADAHQKYAEMLRGMADNSDDLDSRTQAALGSLGTLASGANPYIAIANFLANGIVWSRSESSDNLTIHRTRKMTWSDSDSRRFSAMIATQASLHYSIIQSEFPELGLGLRLQLDMPEKTEFSPQDWNDVGVKMLKERLEE